MHFYSHGPPKKRDPVRRRLGYDPWDLLDQNQVFITGLGFRNCYENTTQKLLDYAEILRDTNATSPQQSSVIVQHPIAHIMRQPDLLNTYDAMAKYQELCIKGVMEAESPATRGALSNLGFHLNHLIVFDGLTQHFPTVTGAYTPEILSCLAGEQTCDSLPEWKIEEQGPLNCVGPVPNSSLFRKALELERSQFMKNGLDMRWYGMSWEFTNLFWWQHRAWNGVGPLDCTHHVKGGGGAMMYKYFLQAMN